jgi:hypothetical protein
MPALELLQEYFQKSLPDVHLRRQTGLFRVVESLILSAKLKLTSLGRHMKGSAYVKNKIKAVDRLLGNRYLLTERFKYYQLMTKKIVGNLKQIDIIVDWSPAGNHKNHILRASLAMEGRSIVLYEEIHSECYLGKYTIHKKFLESLKRILPAQVKPIIITDAGFRTEWFELVQSHGWDFEGRIYSNIHYQMKEEPTWKSVASLYHLATRKAKYIGFVKLAKSRALACEMYIYTEKAKRNKSKKQLKKRKRFKSAKCEARYRNQHYKPWVLVTSVSHRVTKHPEKVVRKYKRRMKIEHEFRTIKNNKWGMGFNQAKTQSVERLAIFLLIAAIAMLILWLIGVVAEIKLLHLHYQSNTVKKRRNLSLIFLGKQIIQHDLDRINKKDLLDALNVIKNRETLFLQ